MGDKDTSGQRANQRLLKNPPVMTSNMSYAEWKGELELWATITEVPKNKQGDDHRQGNDHIVESG